MPNFIDCRFVISNKPVANITLLQHPFSALLHRFPSCMLIHQRKPDKLYRMEQLVLLIDDDREELDILTLALDAAGINTIMCAWAKSAEYAFHLFEHIVPDFIFLDFNMPKMDGLACLKQLKKINRIRDVPVVFYSTSINEDIKKQALETGADCCIQKPGTINDLAEKLADIFIKNGAGAAS
jgi:CheY-like chemotaxis protein